MNHSRRHDDDPTKAITVLECEFRQNECGKLMAEKMKAYLTKNQFYIYVFVILAFSAMPLAQSLIRAASTDTIVISHAKRRDKFEDEQKKILEIQAEQRITQKEHTKKLDRIIEKLEKE